jgi:hypothetical protein
VQVILFACGAFTRQLGYKDFTLMNEIRMLIKGFEGVEFARDYF